MAFKPRKHARKGGKASPTSSATSARGSFRSRQGRKRRGNRRIRVNSKFMPKIHAATMCPTDHVVEDDCNVKVNELIICENMGDASLLNDVEAEFVCLKESFVDGSQLDIVTILENDNPRFLTCPLIGNEVNSIWENEPSTNETPQEVQLLTQNQIQDEELIKRFDNSKKPKSILFRIFRFMICSNKIK